MENKNGGNRKEECTQKQQKLQATSAQEPVFSNHSENFSVVKWRKITLSFLGLEPIINMNVVKVLSEQKMRKTWMFTSL